MCERHSLTRVSHPAKKGGLKVGKTKRGKGTKIMAVADRDGLPVSVCVDGASPHEVTLATSTFGPDGYSRRTAEVNRRPKEAIITAQRRRRYARFFRIKARALRDCFAP